MKARKPNKLERVYLELCALDPDAYKTIDNDGAVLTVRSTLDETNVHRIDLRKKTEIKP